jgi:PAS domain S-box-containing protein
MSKKILIIEDDIDLRETTKEFLCDTGYNVYTAENGAQGIQLAIQHIPDAIICDINMEGISGYEVYNMLHQINTTSVIPFIFLSAKSTREEILTGLHLGADDYITKPFEFSELLDIVDKRIENRKKIVEQNDEKFNVLFKKINSGACILNKSTFEYVNDPLSKLLGYSCEELQGLSITNIAHRDSLQVITNSLENCFEGAKKTFTVSCKFICKDQSIKSLEIKGSSIQIKGTPGIICVFTDENITPSSEIKEQWHKLPKISEREMDVLNLVCQGFSNSEISEKLFISERTVEGHRARLFSKTGTKNAVALAMWAVKHNLVCV